MPGYHPFGAEWCFISRNLYAMRGKWLLLYGILGVGCGTSPLEIALDRSGENRSELEKVLKHYSDAPADSLKYRAACFLIENMPGHGWYEGDEPIRYRRWVDSLYGGIRDDQREMLYQAPLSKPFIVKELVRKEDLKCLKADFLIRHIERSFRAWQHLPWLSDLPFGDFCEYVLPYRCADENPYTSACVADSAAMEQLRQMALKYDDIAHEPGLLKSVYSPAGHYITLPGVSSIRYNGRTIAFEPAGCTAASLCELIDHRRRLMPAAIDFTPAFPHLNNRHYWVSLIDPRAPGGSLTSYRNERVGKIYRKVFSHQPRPESAEGEFIPPFFREPFYKDVTDKYASVTEVCVAVDNKVKARTVYLCVFNDRKWTPVAFAGLKGRKAVFRKVGKGVVYLPVVYEQERQVAVGFPFIPRYDGSTQVLAPDTTALRDVRLTRKFPVRYPVYGPVRELSGCRIEAAADSMFRHPVVAAEIGEENHFGLKSVGLQVDTAYRYWRLVMDAEGKTVAEIMFYEECGRRLEAVRFLSSGHRFERPAAVFDNDALTCSYVDRWVGADFGRAVRPVLARCIGRNDDNGIWPGHIYELLYRGSEEWVSLGMQEAQTETLNYSNVPAGCLLLLKNYTRGREERLFTCDEKGTIRFW